ncbi:membrane protein, putative [Pseudooceanicola batsensis HTCC2597]|uniref:Membrane protein, putative n=1 Tax=Pseudooceanicola batsensis (strain ATCC BAA-863 / DSM 15984 / KCTC 12145 / HTCC2597) TaxID=252305 RepID=A3U3T6_PSEBH|nr:DMT family transporter [Pseudooceanicola batsensis]EAQ01175.1 membrane protein, putative [Pseudooceanicola batsensis HTCC2597]
MRPEWVLIGVTFLWGGTFLAVQTALTWSGPLFFVGLRFALAAICLGVIAGRRMLRLTLTEIRAGSWIGLAIALGYGMQTVGLQSIASSKSAFITALYVPLVPILQWIFLGRPPGPLTWLGVGFATLGLMLIAGPEAGGVGFSPGELITILSVFAIAGEVILISRFAQQVDAARVTVVQLAVASLLAFTAMGASGEAVPAWDWRILAFAGALGLASAAIQLAMNWAQRSVTATRSTLIYAGEPVWAAIIGRLAGEVLALSAVIGGGLIVLGMVLGEWPARRRPGRLVE